MSLKVYRAILDKVPEVDKFYGNEDKVRKALLPLYASELSKEVGIGRNVTMKVISLLQKNPRYQSVFF